MFSLKQLTCPGYVSQRDLIGTCVFSSMRKNLSKNKSENKMLTHHLDRDHVIRGELKQKTVWKRHERFSTTYILEKLQISDS